MRTIWEKMMNKLLSKYKCWTVDGKWRAMVHVMAYKTSFASPVKFKFMQIRLFWFGRQYSDLVQSSPSTAWLDWLVYHQWSMHALFRLQLPLNCSWFNSSQRLITLNGLLPKWPTLKLRVQLTDCWPTHSACQNFNALANRQLPHV
jgi:hypothetical protein